MDGPLTGTRVVEVAAIGPAPYGTMLLADLGADVVRVDRVDAVGRSGAGGVPAMDGLSRNRRSLALDLKHDGGLAVLLDLVATCDVLVEGFRPGVAERLGFGPDTCTARNPGLVYARMTGWGQDGPLAATAGHDIGYAAVAGALHPIGRRDDSPPPPLNLVADFGGGGTFLAIGVLAALLERGTSGRGQVVDVAMVDGTASLTAFFHGLLRAGAWSTDRQANLLDGGAPFYDTYTCADGRFLAVGAIEPQFHAELCAGLGIDPSELPQHDRASWPDQKQRIAAVVATRTRDEWVEVFAGTDACVAPVLDLAEAPTHPHLRERATFATDDDGGVAPAPAPRFSRTPGSIRRPAPRAGAHTRELLAELGRDGAAVDELLASGAAAAVPDAPVGGG